MTLRMAACVGLALLSGCGYGFVAAGSPQVLGVVAITEFSNDTAEVGLGHDCAATLRDRLGTGVNPGVASAEAADLVVVGRVSHVVERPLALASGGVDLELEVTVAVRAVNADGDLVYEGEVRGVDAVRSGRGAGAAHLARGAGARRACRDAMDTLVDELRDAARYQEVRRGQP